MRMPLSIKINEALLLTVVMRWGKYRYTIVYNGWATDREHKGGYAQAAESLM